MQKRNFPTAAERLVCSLLALPACDFPAFFGFPAIDTLYVSLYVSFTPRKLSLDRGAQRTPKVREKN